MFSYIHRKGAQAGLPARLAAEREREFWSGGVSAIVFLGFLK
jgi:hypothetical protein